MASFPTSITTLTGKELVRVVPIQTSGKPSGEDIYATTGTIAGAPNNFGSGTATFASEGNLLNTGLLSAGLISPAATGADNVLAVYSLPANSLDKAGRGLQITTMGSFAANANTKQCKIIFNPTTAVVGSTVGSGGTIIADTGASTGNNVGWALSSQVIKVGVAGSNTQYAQETAAIVGTSHGGIGLPLFPTATEGGVILIAVTGNATTTATDIKMAMFQITAAE